MLRDDVIIHSATTAAAEIIQFHKLVEFQKIVLLRMTPFEFPQLIYIAEK